MKRASGVLMHVSSLYGDYSIGSFGKEAKEFVDFLAQFSINKEFQINHTIFPLPVTRPNPKEKKKLLLPRDWEHLSFAKIYPQIVFLHPDREANNRKIYIYQMGRLTQVFNFIRINKQWYLIEKYEK